MKLQEVKDILNAKVLVGNLKEFDENSFAIERVFASDLMSDVLAFAEERTMLLTGLTNLQAIRTAEMLDIEVVVFVRGKLPNQEILNLASEKGIIILATDNSMYDSCGRLYQKGVKGMS
ncbi:hypothetical protein [Natranaerofaba carboxydovora]|uniref:hypothetical protein n=1 Tax=Natranaerofaba carboxydovora TaxID=2742683 RepID=UPI001F1470C7|nr:hypothetical protein [Natranaerofaba carboxydovora]UMZ75293.1 hypothetical protein ACONDI_02913 [Natranaerofaba carboxydovora]